MGKLFTNACSSCLIPRSKFHAPPPVIYIAGERQHAGKTVSSLGLISALCNRIAPKDIGYFKPLGQEMVPLSSGRRIDKDIRIVQEFTELDMPDLEMLSPVRVVDGVTREHIACSNPRARTAEYEKSILESLEYLSNKKLIIAEGTGHPGVGAVVGLSNARVANLLGAQILYLGGGIGRTLDELEVDLTYFSYHRSRVAGILFNKVIPSKVGMMREAIDESALARCFPDWTPALDIFGYMPQVKYLNNPSMKLAAKSFPRPRVIKGASAQAWRRPCRKVKVISQGAETFSPDEHLNPRDIVVLGGGSHRRLKRILDFNEALSADKLGGIILTCANDEMPDATAVQWLEKSGLPTFSVTADAGEVDELLYACFRNTKLQLYDRQKHRQIEVLFRDHFDVNRFLRRFGL